MFPLEDCSEFGNFVITLICKYTWEFCFLLVCLHVLFWNIMYIFRNKEHINLYLSATTVS